MTDNIITIKNLKKEFKVPCKQKEGLLASVKLLFKREYKLVTAVDNINLDIKKGEIRGLIGPNGAGKSTTIKMISGILYPTSGSVDVMGYNPWLQRKEYVKKIGVLLGQKTQLLWDLPPIDTYLLNKEMYKIPEKNFRDNLEYFKQMLGLEEIIIKPVRNLSLGERMKCEIVCAMLHEPKLVYLDEPTIGLDVFAKDAIRKFIKKINKDREITFILTTHDLSDIEDLCHNVTIINKGSVVFNDSIDCLKTYFSDRKLIDVKFTEPISENALNGFNVVWSTPFSAKMEIDLKCSNIQDEVFRIFTTLPVQDINIENINIEEVIKQIYSS
ncbi:MAG TPA: ATP-binding cassette domain-containing protein [Clostridia bacterium]|nr:ATP-binding cassette domain-containing protein [Clostridia bacterium]